MNERAPRAERSAAKIAGKSKNKPLVHGLALAKQAKNKLRTKKNEESVGEDNEENDDGTTTTRITKVVMKGGSPFWRDYMEIGSSTSLPRADSHISGGPFKKFLVPLKILFLWSSNFFGLYAPVAILETAKLRCEGP